MGLRAPGTDPGTWYVLHEGHQTVGTTTRITITSNRVVLIGQTSLGNVFEFDVDVEPPPPIQLVFWRQLF